MGPALGCSAFGLVVSHGDIDAVVVCPTEIRVGARIKKRAADRMLTIVRAHGPAAPRVVVHLRNVELAWNSPWHALPLWCQRVRESRRGVTFNLGTVSWVDDSVSETAYVVEKSTGGGAWTEVQRVDRVLAETNLTGEVLTFTDGAWITGDKYRVIAENTVRDDWNYGVPNAFPTTTAKSLSAVVS